MNNVLNIQLIEQLLGANESTEMTFDSFCQSIHQAFSSQLKSFVGVALYQQEALTYVEKAQTHNIDDGLDKILTPDKYASVLSVMTDKKHKIDNSTIYLPLYSEFNDSPNIIFCIIVNDIEERDDLHWSLLHQLILREFQRLHIGSNADDTATLTLRLTMQTQIQRALNELSVFASTNRDEKLLLDKGAETLLQFFDIDHIGIMIIDEDYKFANLVSDVPPQNASVQRIPVEGEHWEQLAKGQHIILENITATDIDGDSKKIFDAHGIQSALIIPFIDLTGKHIGSIGMDKFNGRIKMSDEQIQSARLISAQLVSHLQNLRLLQSSQRFANQMQQIAKFGEMVQSRFELQEILQTSLHFTHRILEVDYINIILYDESLQKLIVRAYHQKGKEVILPLDNPIMPTENTAVGKVWASREPVYINRYKASEYDNPYTKDIQVLYATALISRGVTRGVIEVGRENTKELSTIDRNVMSQLANQLAVSLENSTTYTQTQRLTQNKILANEISLQLQQQMDIDSLLNTTITELGKALGAKRARIRLGVQKTVDEN